MKTSATPARTRCAGNTSAGHRASLCNALGELKSTLAATPSGAFDLANCAEINGRDAEAVRLLEKYLEMSPEALDRKEIHVRIADLKSLLTLPGKKASRFAACMRRLWFSRGAEYDRALADLNKAEVWLPNSPSTKWKLGLFYEAMGNVDQARGKFHAYQQLRPSKAPKMRPICISALWMRSAPSTTKKSMRLKISSPILFNRAMNLTFQRVRKAQRLAGQARAGEEKEREAKHEIESAALPFLLLTRSSNWRGPVSICKSRWRCFLSAPKPTS